MGNVPGMMTTHETDSDCTLDGDDQCVVCGVSHTYTCDECGSRGFHRADCPELDGAA